VAVDRRRELVDAGVRLLGEQRFQGLMSAIDVSAIADDVGVTSGSFFHHFRNRAHFAEAVADAFVERWAHRVENLAQASTGALESEALSGLRPAAAAEWHGLVNGGEMATLQHLLWAVRDEPLADGTARTPGQLLCDGYALLGETVEDTYQRGLRLMGREMLPPFTARDLTVVMTAFAEGMQMRHGVDPEAVREDLYADTVAAILLGVTRPRVERSESMPSVELATLETRYLVHKHVVRRVDTRAGTWRHIADAAAHLFVDRSAADVRVSEVAAAAGVSTTTVNKHFGTVTAVAAAGWARHVPEMEAIAAEPITAEEGPIQRIEQVLLRYVELARQNRGATEALAAQVVAEAAPASGRSWPRSTREIVPVPGILLPLIRELRAVGRLRRRMETERLARSLVHLCTMQALLFPEESDERIVDETMSLVFDGALVAPSG
jgi:AcrR family transcriptional regulator